jgi:hypothetical protein
MGFPPVCPSDPAHEARLVEQERGGIQILERAKATLLTGVFDAGEHGRDQLVKQVEDVVEGRDLLNLGEGEEGRLAAGRRDPGDGLRSCCGGVPSQGVDPDRRHGGQLDGASPRARPPACLGRGSRRGCHPCPYVGRSRVLEMTASGVRDDFATLLGTCYHHCCQI